MEGLRNVFGVTEERMKMNVHFHIMKYCKEDAFEPFRPDSVVVNLIIHSVQDNCKERPTEFTEYYNIKSCSYPFGGFREKCLKINIGLGLGVIEHETKRLCNPLSR